MGRTHRTVGGFQLVAANNAAKYCVDGILPKEWVGFDKKEESSGEGIIDLEKSRHFIQNKERKNERYV